MEGRMSKEECPLCGQKEKALLVSSHDQGNIKSYKCDLCGYYTISGYKLGNYDFKKYTKIKRLIFAIRELSSINNPFIMKNGNELGKDNNEYLDEIIQKVKFPETIKDKVDLLIKDEH